MILFHSQARGSTHSGFMGGFTIAVCGTDGGVCGGRCRGAFGVRDTGAVSRALSLFPRGSHCLYDMREVSISDFFPFFLRGIWDASSFVPSVFSAGRFQGMFTQRDFFLSLLNAFRNGCVGEAGDSKCSQLLECSLQFEMFSPHSSQEFAQTIPVFRFGSEF